MTFFFVFGYDYKVPPVFVVLLWPLNFNNNIWPVTDWVRPLIILKSEGACSKNGQGFLEKWIVQRI